MNNNENRSFFQQAFRIGTPECAVFSAIVAMLLGFLFLWIGFWKTLLLFVLMLIGGFIGGVEDKQEKIRGLVNRLFPAKPAVTYSEPRHGAGKAARRASQETEKEAQPEEDQYDDGDE